MTLTTNEQLVDGTNIRVTWQKAQNGNPERETTSSESGRKARYHQFVVSPSPCNNGGDHVAPTAYNYAKLMRVLPYGTLTYTQRDWDGRLEVKSVVSGSHATDKFGRSTPLGSYNLPAVGTDARQKSLAKFYEAIRSSEVSLNTSVGEARESLAMIASIAKSAARATRELRKLKKSLQMDPLQTVGGLWLGWSVGLKPLLSDCENIRNHALRDGFSDSLMFDVKARASHLRKFSASSKGMLETYAVDERVQFGAKLKITNAHQYENWRAGLTARPTLLWELTTLSFVVDYFVNIGQYLELFEASMFNNGFELVYGYETTVTKSVREKTLDKTYTRTSPYDLEHASLRMVEEETTKQRKLMTSLPRPGAPVVKIPRAAEQLLNCAALLSGLITRKKP